MKAICVLDSFKKAILSSERITSRQITLPILNNILIKGENNKIVLKATNLEIGIVAIINAKIDKPGEIAVPAKIIANFTNNLSDDDNEKVTLEVEKQTLKIECGPHKAVIKGMATDEFPIIPQKKEQHFLKISKEVFKNITTKLLTSVGIGETRQELSGVNIQLGEEKLILASTDSFRLTRLVIPLKESFKGEGYSAITQAITSIIIPTHTLSEVGHMSGEQEIEVRLDENQIFFSNGEVQLVSRLINGNYPEYEQIIPQQFNTRAVINKDELLRIVRMAHVFSAAQSNEIEVEVKSKEKKVLVSSNSEELGSNRSEAVADIEGPDQKVIFNAKYIIDGLTLIDSRQLALLINDPARPAGIKMLNDKGEVREDFIYIVMPVKNQ